MTLKEALEQLSGYLVAGTETIQINTAMERLLAMGKFKGLTRTLDLIAYENGTITLPSEYETLLGCALHGAGQYIRDPWFEIAPRAPWNADARLKARDLEDGHVLYRDLPAGTTQFRVICNAADAAVDFSVTAQRNGDQGILTDTEQTEAATLVSGHSGFLDGGPWVSVTNFTKGRTSKPVSLEAYNGEWVEVARLAPRDTVASFRKYAIPMAKEGDLVRARCKRRFLRAEGDNDELPIDSIYSLRLALEALSYEASGDIRTAANFWVTARKALDDALSEHRGSSMRTVPIFCRAAAGSKLRALR